MLVNIFLKGKNLLFLSGLTFSLFYKHRFLIAMFAKPTNIIDFLNFHLSSKTLRSLLLEQFCDWSYKKFLQLL